MAQIDAVLSALTSPRFPLRDALPALPDQAGLYAIYGDELAWAQLQLSGPSHDLPLYVGKAEESLVTRDLKTHFADGRTGSSTVRRSFAALLRTQLSLSGLPRNLAKPGYFAHYGLSPADDAALTRWMLEHLTIAVWPSDYARPLDCVETDVLHQWNPPINLSKVTHSSRAFVRSQRKTMADQARAWRPE